MEQQGNKILEDTKLFLVKNEISVDQYAYHWIEVHKPYIKNSTYATYLSNIENHIIPYFKSLKLENIFSSV